MKLMINTEYAPDYLKEVSDRYAEIWQLDETQFASGRGHHKTVQQRHYELLKEYSKKLEEYVEKIQICGDGRNSHSKTDHSATFMRTVWVADGHGKSVLEQFYKSLTDEQLASIKVVTGDGARWITDCVNEFTPDCERCVDPFHVVEWAMDARRAIFSC